MVSAKKEMKLTKNSHQKNDYYSKKLDTFPKEIFNIYEYNINRLGKVSKFWGCFVSVLCNNFFRMGVWCCGCHTHTHTHTFTHYIQQRSQKEKKNNGRLLFSEILKQQTFHSKFIGGGALASPCFPISLPVQSFRIPFSLCVK